MQKLFNILLLISTVVSGNSTSADKQVPAGQQVENTEVSVEGKDLKDLMNLEGITIELPENFPVKGEGKNLTNFCSSLHGKVIGGDATLVKSLDLDGDVDFDMVNNSKPLNYSIETKSLNLETKCIRTSYFYYLVENEEQSNEVVVKFIKDTLTKRYKYLKNTVSTNKDLGTEIETYDVTIEDSSSWLERIKYEIKQKEDQVDDITAQEDQVDEDETKLKLEFKNRRDDQIANFYYDCLIKNKEDKDKCTKEKDNMEKQKYIPSLWKNLNIKDNEEIVNTFLDKHNQVKDSKFPNQINIPFQYNWTKENNSDGEKTFYHEYEKAQEYLQLVFAELSEKTCINFLEVTQEDDLFSKINEIGNEQQYLSFTNNERRGCDEIIGQKPLTLQHPQVQPFGSKCTTTKYSMGHYIMHILGFDNEHQRSDVKDLQFTNLNTLEIGQPVSQKVPILQKREGHNDLKDNTDNLSYLYGDYDTASIMHWSNDYLAHESLTIPHMRAHTESSGESFENIFSNDDITKIKKAYKCDMEKDITAVTLEDNCFYQMDSAADGHELNIPEKCLYNKVGTVSLDEAIEENPTEEEKVSGKSHVYIQEEESKEITLTITYNISNDVANQDVEEDPVENEEAVSNEDLELLIEEPEDTEKEARRLEEVDGLTILKEEDDIVKENYPEDFSSLQVEGDMQCNKARFSTNIITNENTSDLQLYCGQGSIEIKSMCGKPLHVSYELNNILDSNIEVKTPTLQLVATYNDCEDQESALKESSSMNKSIHAFLLSLIF